MSDPAETADVDRLLTGLLPALRTYVRMRMGPELRSVEESCDIVQSVAREVLLHSERFDHGGAGGFRRWLFTTAHRKILDRVDHMRAARRDVGRLERDGAVDRVPAAEVTPSLHAAAREEFVRVEAAFDLLSDEQRDVVTMSKLLGLTHGEIGERIGKSEVAVRKILSRALARVAARLARDEL
ncbi:MAG: RNA polymerase sigma factor [Planctomycetota bacterium]